MPANGRFGGHMVLGHADGLGKGKYIKKEGEFYSLTIEVPSEISKYVVKKGSIAINGISLTVADINNDTVKIREKAFIEYSNIIKLKNDVCEMNKKITEVQRDREAIIPGINLLNKHNHEIKSKLSSQEHFNSNFFLNIINAIEKVNLN
jgi:hypothetical protein